MKTVIYGLFVLGGLVLLTLTLLSRREGARVPGFGDIAGFVMAYQVGRVPVGRIAILGFWWWVGWHFLAR
jgi:hypothetical protein